MKKSVIALCLISILLVLAGCGNKQDEDLQVTNVQPTEQVLEENAPNPNKMGRLILPVEGVRIKGKQIDLDEYINAETQEEKNKILEKLLNDPDNVVTYTEKKNPPSTGGEAESKIP